MSWQRRHGQWVDIWPMVTITDRRGNRIKRVDMTAEPIRIKAAIIPERSTRAEIPGQQEVNVSTMIVDAGLKDVGLWSTVRCDGIYYDIVAPPSYHYGTRATRHWSIPLRARPAQGAGPGESVVPSG